MKGCADKSILGLALAAQYLSHGTYLTACWAKKRQAFFAIKVELGDPLIFPFKGARIPWVFFGSCRRNILTCFSISYFKMHDICSGAQGFKCQIRALLSNLYCA